MVDRPTNDKVYIHELIDITGQHRAEYMHHMTANWVPIAIEERNQLCFGVWGTVGSTGRWPEVVNIWELDGWDGLATNFSHELSHATLQDPSLATWWERAASFRRGGVDRILVPAPWTSPIDDLVAAGVRGQCYAHELVTLRPGAALEYLDALRDIGRAAVESFGLSLVGAFSVAMVNDSECIVIWAIPDWGTWTRFEREQRGETLRPWRAALDDLGADWRRTLLVDAPLAPLRIGRQPAESDRTPDL
ncbi:MAG TPA: NIPSNAP family containing protein [Acidimicrobiia bacterium]|nr:NIPSNAP family containing protein [Acidimicrobiia bacterium]